MVNQNMGEHDVTITVRYKDGVRDEIFVNHDTTIFIEEISNDEENGPDASLVIIPVVIAIGVGFFLMRRRKKQSITS